MKFVCQSWFTPAALGTETVGGFNAQHDQIDFNPTLFANYAAVLHDATQSWANTIITAAQGDIVVLLERVTIINPLQ